MLAFLAAMGDDPFVFAARIHQGIAKDGHVHESLVRIDAACEAYHVIGSPARIELDGEEWIANNLAEDAFLYTKVAITNPFDIVVYIRREVIICPTASISCVLGARQDAAVWRLVAYGLLSH